MLGKINYGFYIFSKLKSKFTKRFKPNGRRRKFDHYKYYEEIINEPKKKSNQTNFLLSLDDASLKRKSLITSDNGGDYPSYLSNSLNNILDFGYRPTIFFVPSPSYCYLADSSATFRYDKYAVKNNYDSPALARFLELEKLGLLEVALHGYTHHNPNLSGFHSFEFDGLSRDLIKKRIYEGIKELSIIIGHPFNVFLVLQNHSDHFQSMGLLFYWGPRLQPVKPTP
jgi:hypothetical protein